MEAIAISILSGKRQAIDLSDAELLVARAEVGRFLSKATTASSSVPYAQLDADLRRILQASYNETRDISLEHVRSILRGKDEFGAEAVQEILEETEKTFQTASTTRKDEIGAAIAAAYVFERRRVGDLHGIEEYTLELEGEVADRLAEHHVLSLGGYFGKFQRLAVEGVLLGMAAHLLDADAIEETLETALEGKLGIRGRGGWANKPLDYYGSMATHAVTRARAFGALTSLAQAGVGKYRIVEVNDLKTCLFCKTIHGTVFNVSDGIALRDQILAATTPEEVSSFATWISGSKLRSLMADGGVEAMVTAGLTLPPYHLHCRGRIRAVVG